MPNPDPHPTPAENTSPLSALLEGREPVDAGNDIDDRMAALLKDHQEMGARPEVDATVDTYEATYPLQEKSSLPKSMTSGAKTVKRTKKAAAKK